MSGTSDHEQASWDRRQADQQWRNRLERRLDEIAAEVHKLRDDHLERTARNKVYTQVVAVAGGVLGVLWLLVQLSRVYLYGL